MKKLLILISFILGTIYSYSQSSGTFKDIKFSGASTKVGKWSTDLSTSDSGLNTNAPTGKAVVDEIKRRTDLNNAKSDTTHVFDVVLSNTTPFNIDTLGAKYLGNFQLREFTITVMAVNETNNETALFQRSVFVSRVNSTVYTELKDETRGTDVATGTLSTVGVLIKPSGGAGSPIVVEITSIAATNVRWQIHVTPTSLINLQAL